MSRRGLKGALRQGKGLHLDTSDLPPLRSPKDAETWLERIGRAVATGRLRNRDGDVTVRAVREWLRAHEAGKVTEQVQKLGEQVATLKKRSGLKAV